MWSIHFMGGEAVPGRVLVLARRWTVRVPGTPRPESHSAHECVCSFRGSGPCLFQDRKTEA